MTATCETCMWWSVTATTPGQFFYRGDEWVKTPGTCRIRSVADAFPMRDGLLDWCGEHQPKETRDA